ncbi:MULTISPECIES: antitoxin VbhA family protein [unclassified Bradyrhizobium]|uniref:antitoxin VbhA family protein n=1 Tax=unclassified Bradyrhizobium TaxID=2631580 RepID=UPI0033998889
MPDDARESRAVAVANAIAITRIEGHEPSMFALQQLDRWVAGEITPNELRALVRQHHAKPAPHYFVKSKHGDFCNICGYGRNERLQHTRPGETA